MAPRQIRSGPPTLVSTLQVPDSELSPIALSPDGSMLVYQEFIYKPPQTKRILVRHLLSGDTWEVPTRTLLSDLLCGEQATFSSDSRKLFFVCYYWKNDSDLLLTFNAKNGGIIDKEEISRISVFGGPNGNESLFIVGERAKLIRLDLSTKKKVSFRKAYTGVSYLSPDLLLALQDSEQFILNASTGAPFFSFTPSYDRLVYHRLSADQSLLLLVHGYFDGGWRSCGCWHETEVSVWDMKTGEQIKHPRWKYADISPDGNRAIAITKEEKPKVIVWDLDQNKELFSLPITPNPAYYLNAVALYAAEGSIILTVVDDRLERWDAQTGEPLPLKKLSGDYLGRPEDLQTIADGELFLTGGEPSYLWSARTGEPLTALGSWPSVRGNFIITHDDSQLSVWKLPFRE